MSWTDSKEFLDKYRDDRARSLNNEQRCKWSTHEVDTLQDMVDKFTTEEENANWEAMYVKEKEDALKLMGIRLKIDYLAGCRRDVRMQFACGNTRPRTALDSSRFEYMRLSFYKQKLEALDSLLTKFLSGGETIP